MIIYDQISLYLVIISETKNPLLLEASIEITRICRFRIQNEIYYRKKSALKVENRTISLFWLLIQIILCQFIYFTFVGRFLPPPQLKNQLIKLVDDETVKMPTKWLRHNHSFDEDMCRW